MENDKDFVEEIAKNVAKEQAEREPFITFYAFPLEMWFWRIATPLALILSILALLK